jgi:hypothetical protein
MTVYLIGEYDILYDKLTLSDPVIGTKWIPGGVYVNSKEDVMCAIVYKGGKLVGHIEMGKEYEQQALKHFQESKGVNDEGR